MSPGLTKTVYQTTVFSDGPGGGNPCPVVLDADDLSAQQGMSLAERFMAETIFVTASRKPPAEFRFRYFVPHHEMEMCVHATIAAVTVLRSLQMITAPAVQIETLLGLISVEWQEDNETIIVTVNQFAAEFSTQNPTVEEVADVLRLVDVASIRQDLPIVSVSTSRHKLIVPLESVQTLDQLQPDFDAMWALCDRFNTTGVYPFALVEDDGVYAARQFPKRAGYDEDPATGVAACALGAYLSRFLQTKHEGWNSFVILQGRAMGRPSRLIAQTLMEDGVIRETKVTGKAEILDHETISL